MNNLFTLEGFEVDYKPITNSILKLTILLVSLFVLGIVMGMGLPLIFKNAAFYSVTGFLYRTVTSIISILFILFLFKKFFKIDTLSVVTFGRRRIDMRKLMLWICVGAFLMLVSFLIHQCINDVTLSFVGFGDNVNFLWASTVYFIFGAIKEEILYRCMILQVLDQKRMNKYLVIVVSAVLFTLIHGWDLPLSFFFGHDPIDRILSLFDKFIFGLIFGFLAYKERRIELLVGLHFAHNVMISVFLYMFQYTHRAMPVGFNLLLVLLYGVIVFYRKRRSERRGLTSETSV